MIDRSIDLLLCVSDLDNFSLKREKKIQKRKQKKAALKATALKYGLVQTLATITKPAYSSSPDIVTFVSHKNKKKSLTSLKVEVVDQPVTEAEEANQPEAVSLKEARFEVFKFGLQALSKQDRMEAKAALAIKLGAIPPKKKPCLPYAQLKEQRKQERLEQERAAEENESKLISKRRPTNKVSGKGQKKKAKKGGDSSSAKSGGGGGGGGMPMGSFDGGMLKLSGKDLAKLRGKKS